MPAPESELVQLFRDLWKNYYLLIWYFWLANKYFWKSKNSFIIWIDLETHIFDSLCQKPCKFPAKLPKYDRQLLSNNNFICFDTEHSCSWLQLQNLHLDKKTVSFNVMQAAYHIFTIWWVTLQFKWAVYCKINIMQIPRQLQSFIIHLRVLS